MEPDTPDSPEWNEIERDINWIAVRERWQQYAQVPLIEAPVPLG